MAARTLFVVSPPTPTALEHSFSDYLASARARGLSPRTLDGYEWVLRRVFLPFIVEQGVTTPEDITQRVLDRLSAHLLDRDNLSRHSVDTYLRTCADYLSWAHREGEITHPAKPQSPRLPHKVLLTLTREQIRALEDAAATERDKLIVRILADTGVRLAELLGLTLADLIEQGRDRFLKVTGKGSRERLVPVAPGLFTRLRRFAARGRPEDARTDRIFVTLRRDYRSGTYEPLDPRGVEQMLHALARRVGIEQRVYPHLLRHSFATWALQRNMNAVTLQRILGHADLTMISGTYAHLVPADTAAAMMALLRED
jgi:integrase/recombinase XerD